MKKKITASVIIPSFMRHDLLDYGLHSISGQTIKNELEIIVLNDGLEDETEKICEKYSKHLLIRYIFTGQRNKKDKIKSRVPGFAINIGIKQAVGDIVILTCPEIIHLQNDTFEKLVKPFFDFHPTQCLSTVSKVYDDYMGSVLNVLKEHGKLKITLSNIEEMCNYKQENFHFITNCYMPYCMAISKKRLIEIGGYDEDLIGYAVDDNDIIDRLLKSSCHYIINDAKIIHLFHGGKPNYEDILKDERYIFNLNLFRKKKDIIVRNMNREWGVYNEN